MIYLVLAFFTACFLPLFVSSWRFAFLALAVQAVAVASLTGRSASLFSDWPSLVRLAEILLFRVILVPVLFIGVLRRFRVAPALDLIPANLVAWGLVLTLVILGYRLGQDFYPTDVPASLHLGTVTFAILAALFVLSLQVLPIGQAIALLTLESGISLFEASSPHSEPLLIQVGMSGVFLGLLVLMRKFLFHFQELEQTPEGAEPEREVL